jgi:hypothetical protein
MTKKIKLSLIRPEDILALLMILPSLWVTSPSEYYYLFNGNIVVSKHMTALMLLFVFAIFTALYENRIQRIIDTIKSGVKIPAVTIADQIVHLWKNKFRILYVIRDYLPFLVCVIAYHRLTVFIPEVNMKDSVIDRIFMSFDRFLIEDLRLYFLTWTGNYTWIKDLLSLSYKTYFLAVPILATYLYMLKEFDKFREFMLAISIGTLISLLFSIIMPCLGLEAVIKSISSDLTGSISLPAVYTATVFFYAFKFNKTLALFYLPIAFLFFIADILTYSNYLLSIILSLIIGYLAIPIAKYIKGAWA